MATTVGQHQVGAISDPADGSLMVASTMRSVSTTLRTGINDHDNESGLHLQSSAASSRPAAGTAGRKWLDTDTLIIKYDNGSSWVDLNYLKLSGGTVTGALTVSAGGITVTGDSTITGTLGGVTTLTATTLAGTLSTAAQPNVTSVGTLSSLTLGGTLTMPSAGKIVAGATSFAIRNSADSGDLFKYTESSDLLEIGTGSLVLGVQIGAGQLASNNLTGANLPKAMVMTVAGPPTGAPGAGEGSFCFENSGGATFKLWVYLNAAWKAVAVA